MQILQKNNLIRNMKLKIYIAFKKVEIIEKYNEKILKNII